jgi:hypothetical protein
MYKTYKKYCGLDIITEHEAKIGVADLNVLLRVCQK